MASYLPNLTQDNISYHTIPLIWLISISPRLWGRRLYKQACNKSMDVGHPRDFAQTVSTDAAVDSQTRGRIVRAEAAMQNGFDNIALFAAAVVAGNTAGLSPQLLNGLSLGYVASRVAYNYVYVQNWAKARIVTFFGGLGMCFALFVKAGGKFKGTS